MKDVIIKVRNISKSYKINKRQDPSGSKSLREDITNFFKSPFRKQQIEQYWALNDINIDIHQGEMVGLIGPNGAGKSTLLKILARITEPDSGRIDIYGHIGAILEIGTGFHPELSGRENVFLSGAILGMKRKEIADRFDEIVDFAGLGDYIDNPVKKYSSGMFLRLAFSVMAALDTDILIADEVLAVGDAAFQQKCLRRMQGIANRGRTVIFVSHQTDAIAAFCERTLLVMGGKIVKDGPTKEVIDYYYKMLNADQQSSQAPITVQEELTTSSPL